MGAIGDPVPPAGAADHERRINDLRAALGDAAFESAFAAGRALFWEQAIAFVQDERDSAAEQS